MSLDNLKKVCLEATIGPWTWRADGIVNKYIDDNAVVVSGDECKEMDPANCRFISTFNPSLVAKLLAVVEEAEYAARDRDYGGAAQEALIRALAALEE